MSRPQITRALRIGWTVGCGIAGVWIVLSCVSDIRNVGIVAVFPYARAILWCVVLAALPWANAVSRFGRRTLKSAGSFTRHYKVRVALSAIFLTATLLLTWLWVQSVSWSDTLLGVIGTQRLQFTSENGALIIYAMPEQSSPNYPNRAWTYQRHGQPTVSPKSSWEFSKLLPAGIVLSAPHWFSVSTFGLLTAIPWLSWLLPSRFSLRTLLIATTLVAVALGLIVWASR